MVHYKTSLDNRQFGILLEIGHWDLEIYAWFSLNQQAAWTNLT